jgi:hypothetical protein
VVDLVVRARNSFGPNKERHHRGHSRGDVIEVFRKGKLKNLTSPLFMSGIWRIVSVPAIEEPMQFLYLLQTEQEAIGGHKKKWRLDLDTLEARAAAKKGGALGALDVITLVEPNDLHALASVKRRDRARVIG